MSEYFRTLFSKEQNFYLTFYWDDKNVSLIRGVTEIRYIQANCHEYSNEITSINKIIVYEYIRTKKIYKNRPTLYEFQFRAGRRRSCHRRHLARTSLSSSLSYLTSLRALLCNTMASFHPYFTKNAQKCANSVLLNRLQQKKFALFFPLLLYEWNFPKIVILLLI